MPKDLAVYLIIGFTLFNAYSFLNILNFAIVNCNYFFFKRFFGFFFLFLKNPFKKSLIVF